MCNYPMLIKHESKQPEVVPCGMCTACRMQKSKEWATRILHESTMHDRNSFITLTYNPENLPENGSLNKKHFKLFIRNLRYRLKEKIRYYGCGEYGDNNGRPHYHIIIFGWDPITIEELNKTVFLHSVTKDKTGEINRLYISTFLEDVWKKGFVKVGSVTLKSAGYVSRYVIKKITGEMAPSHYKGKLPEFSLMSRMPGIGKPWYDKYKGDIYPKDFFTINGHKCRPNRYYDNLYKQEKPESFNKIKEERKKNIIYHPPIRRGQKEKHKKLTIKLLRRNYETEPDQ